MKKSLARWHWEVIILVSILLLSFIIRFVKVTQIPSGLYWDELDIGYQAYSILQTGKDYFGNPWPIYFHSFADFKTPIFIYAEVPFVAMFGLTPLAVRLPSVLFGTLGVGLFYLVAKELFKSRRIALIAALSLAVSPWDIQFSRMGFEVIAVLPAFLLGMLGFFKGLKNAKWLIVSALGFGLTMWIYSTAKLFVPLTVLVLLVIYRRELIKIPINHLIAPGLILGVLAFVILFFNFFGNGGLRFADLSIFTDPTTASQINFQTEEEALAEGQGSVIGHKPSLVDRAFNNKPTAWWNSLTANYLSAFSTNFLFITGDLNLRQSPSGIGELYRVEIISLILGLIGLSLYKDKFTKKVWLVILGLLLLSPIPSALTRDGATHAIRLFFMLPFLELLVALGIFFIWKLPDLKLRAIALSMYSLVWLISILGFLHFYFLEYKFESASVFQYGIEQAVNYAKQHTSQFDTIVIDAHHDSPLMAYLFFNRVNPAHFQSLHPIQQTNLTGGINGDRLGKTLLVNAGEHSWTDLLNSPDINYLAGKGLILISADELNNQPESLQRGKPLQVFLVKTLYYPDQTPSFYVFQSQWFKESVK